MHVRCTLQKHRTQETHKREIHRRATLAPPINLAPKLTHIRNKRQIEVLNRRYPGRLELRAPQGATPITLRMQAQTAARFEDVTGAGGKGSRQVPLWDQTRIWDPGD